MIHRITHRSEHHVTSARGQQSKNERKKCGLYHIFKSVGILCLDAASNITNPTSSGTVPSLPQTTSDFSLELNARRLVDDSAWSYAFRLLLLQLCASNLFRFPTKCCRIMQDAIDAANSSSKGQFKPHSGNSLASWCRGLGVGLFILVRR
jgi:hypothetical protein